MELDRGQLHVPYPGNFAQYQAQKEEQLAQEAVINARADKLLAQEEVWIRKGVEARRTRSAAARLQQAQGAAARRAASSSAVRLELDAGQPSGASSPSSTRCRCAWRTTHRRALFRDHPARRQGRPDRPQRLRQDDAAAPHPRLGLQPTAGRVRSGTRLQVAYFDQMRAALTSTLRWPRPSARAASGWRSAASAST